MNTLEMPDGYKGVDDDRILKREKGKKGEIGGTKE